MILNSAPATYASVNGDLVYVAYDANAIDATKLNYKYVGELFIGGVKVFTSKVFPRPDNARGIFNFGAIIREYVAAKLSPVSGIKAQELGQGAFAIDVVLKIREEFSGTIGAVVLTDSARTFTNQYDSVLTLNKPQSNRPLVINLFFTNNKYYLPYFATTTVAFNVVIAGNTKIVTPAVANSMHLINISPGAVNNDYPGSITSATNSYTVALGGVTYTVNLICEPIYTNYTLHFLNKFGGFESMCFSKVSRESKELERKEWQQPEYRVNSAGIMTLEENGILHEQSSTFAVKSKKKLSISTDLLSDAEYTWLAELVASPLVYLDGLFVTPVKITNSNYEVKKYINDKLTNLMLDIEFGSVTKSQFR
jgi:hypothetical protein